MGFYRSRGGLAEFNRRESSGRTRSPIRPTGGSRRKSLMPLILVHPGDNGLTKLVDRIRMAYLTMTFKAALRPLRRSLSLPVFAAATPTCFRPDWLVKPLNVRHVDPNR